MLVDETEIVGHHLWCLTRTERLGGQVLKGAWRMPWCRTAMKDAGACEKPWLAGKHAMIQGYPNGETRPS